MNKQEFIDELKKEIEVIRNNTDWEKHVETYEKGKRIGLEIGWMLAEKLDEPEITEEQAWEVIERANHYHIAPADVWKYKEAIQKGLTLSGVSKPELPVIPQFVAETIEKYKDNNDSLGELLSSVEYENIKFYHGLEKYRVDFNDSYPEIVDLCTTIARAWLDGYTVEPPKTLQVIVKNYDSTVFKTEIPEDEAMKLIDGWKKDIE